MKRILALFLTALLLLLCCSVYADSEFESSFKLHYDGEAYSVDYIFDVSQGVDILSVTLNVENCFYDWNYVEADAKLYISIASANSIPNSKVLVTVITDSEVTLTPVSIIVNGSISVKNYTIGDINDDGTINMKDVTLLRRGVIGGYGITLNEAADVNCDGVTNMKDVTILRRYVIGGYGVTLG